LDGKLQQIRSRYSSHVVCVELEGDTSFVETLPMVASVESQENRLEVTLANGDTQQFLRALVQRAQVRSFEVKVPSLHEIFVNLVGEKNAEDS